MTGLITRYIWVWPPWDISEPAISEHTVKRMELGTMMRLGLDGELMLDYCTCLPDGFSDITYDFCYLRNLNESMQFDLEPIKVERKECNIQSTGIVEVVSEEKAIELLLRGNWVTPLDNIILDIDEDYYGVESAVQPLYDVGIKESRLTWLHIYISKLFCSRNAFQERETDKFYNSFLQKIIHLKLYCMKWGQNVSSQCDGRPAMTKTLVQFIPNMLDELQQQRLKSALCTTNETKLAGVIRGLIRHSVGYTVPQLKALSQVGICHLCSVSTYEFDSSNGMKVCDGYNKPNATAIPFHTPSREEINLRTASLREIFKGQSLQPKVVTVCRSTRDGYTPRRYFRQIENGVLNALGDHIKGVDKDMVYYDPDLLGGRLGWHNRH